MVHIYDTSTFYFNSINGQLLISCIAMTMLVQQFDLAFTMQELGRKQIKQTDFGGADGSIILGFGEENRPENNGLQTIIKS